MRVVQPVSSFRSRSPPTASSSSSFFSTKTARRRRNKTQTRLVNKILLSTTAATVYLQQLPGNTEAAKIPILVSGPEYHHKADICTLAKHLFASDSPKILLENKPTSLLNWAGDDVASTCTPTHSPRLLDFEAVFNSVTANDDVLLLRSLLLLLANCSWKNRNTKSAAISKSTLCAISPLPLLQE